MKVLNDELYFINNRIFYCVKNVSNRYPRIKIFKCKLVQNEHKKELETYLIHNRLIWENMFQMKGSTFGT